MNASPTIAAANATGEPHAETKTLAERLSESTADLEQINPDAGTTGIGLLVNRIVEAIGVVALGLIVALIFTNGALRYAIGGTLIWMEEMVILLIPWLAAAGLFLSARRNSLIRIEYFFDLLFPAHWRASLLRLSDSLSGIVLFWLAWVFFDYATRFGWDRTPYLEWPKLISSSAMVAGIVLSALAFVAIVARSFGRRPAAQPEAAPGA